MGSVSLIVYLVKFIARVAGHEEELRPSLLGGAFLAACFFPIYIFAESYFPTTYNKYAAIYLGGLVFTGLIPNENVSGPLHGLMVSFAGISQSSLSCVSLASLNRA